MTEKNKVNDRDLDQFNDQQKIVYLMQKHLHEADMFLKGFDPPYKVKIVSFNAPDTVVINFGEYKPDEEQQVVLFRILGRYMHLQCKVIQKSGDDGMYMAKINMAAIAKINRSSLRLPIKNNEVFISNIRTSKHTIDVSLYNIPTSVKVNFATVEQSLKPMADLVKIDAFKERGSVLHEIQKTGKSLLVSDCNDLKSFNAIDDQYVDYAQYLDDDLTKKMHEYRNQKIKSEAIVPVVYYTHDNSPISLGYIQLQSKTQHFNEATIADLKIKAAQMVERIRDSNTVMIAERQQVVNLSRGGMKVIIDHADLKKYLQRMNGFTFDLFFKGQSPVTLYGTIRAAYMSRDHSLILGIQISGTSSGKTEMKKFDDNIDILEKEYQSLMDRKKALKR